LNCVLVHRIAGAAPNAVDLAQIEEERGSHWQMIQFGPQAVNDLCGSDFALRPMA